MRKQNLSNNFEIFAKINKFEMVKRKLQCLISKFFFNFRTRRYVLISSIAIVILIFFFLFLFLLLPRISSSRGANVRQANVLLLPEANSDVTDSFEDLPSTILEFPTV